MKKEFLLFIFLFNFFEAKPRIIHGVTLDKESGVPVSDVRVIVANDHNALMDTYSNEKGEYSVDIPEGHIRFIFFHIRYKKISIDVTDLRNTVTAQLEKGVRMQDDLILDDWTEKRLSLLAPCDTISIRQNPLHEKLVFPYKEAEYPGGIRCFQYQLLKKMTVNYPLASVKNLGNCILFFTITENGDLTNVKVFGNILQQFLPIIEKALPEISGWKPAQQHGKVSEVRYGMRFLTEKIVASKPKRVRKYPGK